MEQKIDYRLAIDELIPNLHKFSYLKGCEGKVYFASDDFVVKEYFNHRVNPEIFDLFCREMQSFADRGYVVPKVYAWQCEPLEKGCHKFYVLKERVKGQLLSAPQMQDLFHKFKDVCSRKGFEQIVLNPKSDLSLYEQIAVEFLKNFIHINSNLLSVSDNELERFIISEFEMSKKQRYSVTDVQPSNVMFDGKSLIEIDSAFLGREMVGKNNLGIKDKIIEDIVFLFIENQTSLESEKFSPVKSDKIVELLRHNNELCFEAMLRLVRKTTSMLGIDNISTLTLEGCKTLPEHLFDEKHAKVIIEELQK